MFSVSLMTIELGRHLICTMTSGEHRSSWFCDDDCLRSVLNWVFEHQSLVECQRTSVVRGRLAHYYFGDALVEVEAFLFFIGAVLAYHPSPIGL